MIAEPQKPQSEFPIEQLLKRKEHFGWQSITRWFMGFLCLGVVIVIALNVGEMERFLEVLRGIQPEWIILAMLVQALSYVSATGVWHQVLKASGHPIPFRSLYPLSIAQLFVEQALPSNGLTGALLVIKGIRNRGVPESIGMGSMLVGMVSYYTAYILAIFLSLAILGLHHVLNTHHALSAPLLIMASIFSLLAIGVPATVLWLRYLDIHHRLPAFVTRRTSMTAILKVLAESPVYLLKSPALLTKTILLQLSIFFIDAATLAVMLHAVGYAQRYDVVFASLVMAAVAGAVLPVPLGLGAFEGMCVAMLRLFGTPVEAALVAVLLLRGFTFWLPMLPGLWLARRELRT